MKINITAVYDEDGNEVVCVLCKAAPPANVEHGITCGVCQKKITHDFSRYVEIFGPISD